MCPGVFLEFFHGLKPGQQASSCGLAGGRLNEPALFIRSQNCLCCLSGLDTDQSQSRTLLLPAFSAWPVQATMGPILGSLDFDAVFWNDLSLLESLSCFQLYLTKYHNNLI